MPKKRTSADLVVASVRIKIRVFWKSGCESWILPGLARYFVPAFQTPVSKFWLDRERYLASPLHLKNLEPDTPQGNSAGKTHIWHQDPVKSCRDSRNVNVSRENTLLRLLLHQNNPARWYKKAQGRIKVVLCLTNNPDWFASQNWSRHLHTLSRSQSGVLQKL